MIIILFLVTFLFADKYELSYDIFLDSKTKILGVATKNNRIYYYRTNSYPFKFKFKKAFVLTPKKAIVFGVKNYNIYAGIDSKKIKTKLLAKNTTFKGAVRLNNFFFVATNNRVFKLDKNLNILKVYEFPVNIYKIVKYKNKLVLFLKDNKLFNLSDKNDIVINPLILTTEVSCSTGKSF